MHIKGNDPGKRKFDNMGKREKADVITLEDRLDPSAKRSIDHENEYKQCYKKKGKTQIEIQINWYIGCRNV